MYIVGIDIGKRNHEASIMNAAGKQYGKPIRFANSHTGFNKLMDWVKNISGADDVVFEIGRASCRERVCKQV